MGPVAPGRGGTGISHGTSASTAALLSSFPLLVARQVVSVSHSVLAWSLQEILSPGITPCRRRSRDANHGVSPASLQDFFTRPLQPGRAEAEMGEVPSAGSFAQKPPGGCQPNQASSGGAPSSAVPPRHSYVGTGLSPCQAQALERGAWGIPGGVMGSPGQAAARLWEVPSLCQIAFRMLVWCRWLVVLSASSGVALLGLGTAVGPRGGFPVPAKAEI